VGSAAPVVAAAVMVGLSEAGVLACTVMAMLLVCGLISLINFLESSVLQPHIRAGQGSRL